MEDFKWTTELTQIFLHIRLQNDCLFMKKKRAWKDLYKIVMQNNDFPANVTVSHLRKKWDYTIDEYHKAVAQNNTNWIYYDIIHSYLGNSNGMQAYPNWTNEWINRLIDVRTEKEPHFTPSNEFEAWNEVECCLRAMGLPIECSVRKIDFMWCKLLKIFKSKHKFYKDGKTPEYNWPFYAAMKNYFEKYGSSAFPANHSPRRRRNEVQYSDSDDECLIDLKNSLISAKKEFIRIEIPAVREISHNDEEFRWTPQWTESFIHIRLQNESLFKRNKQPWKYLHSIMMENGFPEGITIRHIRKKWNFTLEEYKKAVALNKTKWIYYPLMHSYLGGVDPLDTFKGWSDDWIKNFIQTVMKNNCLFINKKLDEDEYWIIVETQLRKNGLPTECSVRNLNLMWSSLKKAFMEKHKFSMKNNNFQITWPFYEHMKLFHDKYDLVTATMPRSKHPNTKKLKEIVESDDNLFDGDDFDIPEEVDDIKDEVLAATCRACLGTSELMFPLFASDGDVALCDKIMACTSVQITQKDCLPKCVCQNCANELNAAYQFKMKCEETDHVLKTSWQHRPSEVIKNEMIALNPAIGEMEDYQDINADCPMDYYSANDLRDVIMKENLDSFKSDMKNDIKKEKLKGKIKQHLPKKKIVRRSKNSIMYLVAAKSGETVYKRKYVYWKVCEICGKPTQRMKEHLKSHSDIKTHKCHLCPKTFTYTASLQTHIKTHNPTPLQICQLCGREFKRNLTYKRHLMYHANERNFSCETCGKAFNTKDILRIHIRSHTGERPYSCKVCGKSFYSSGCVRRHQKVHRKVHDP